MTSTHEVRIETCTVCNYRCKFCPHSTTFTRKKEVMPQKMFEMLLDKVRQEAPQITECTISGFGEAFLDRGIMDKIGYASAQGYNIHILTNGSLLSVAQLDSLFNNPKIKDLRFSMHAVAYLSYSNITDVLYSDYLRFMANLDYAIWNRGDTKLIITVDVVKENEKDWPVIVTQYKDDVDLIEVWKPHNWVNDKSYRSGPIIKKTCGRPFNGPLQVQVDGTVNMCCFDYNGKLLLGDLKTQSLAEIFEADTYIKIRQAHEAGNISDTGLLCAQCDQLYGSKGAVIYNSKFDEKTRLNKTSTLYEEML